MHYLGGKMRQSRQIVAAIDACLKEDGVWYLGGKMRQAPRIVESIRGAKFTSYVEPFCGALWSATAVMTAFPERFYWLNDVNSYLIKFWQCARDGWDPPAHPTERDYHRYNRDRPINDPMTGYLGFAWSFSGKFFGGPARTNGQFKGSYESTRKKIGILRRSSVKFSCLDFKQITPARGAVVYLDPPYTSRTAQSKGNGVIDRDEYYDYAERLARSCTVIATEFQNPRGWPVLHNYGDTVVRHLNAKPRDGTVELLLRVPKTT